MSGSNRSAGSPALDQGLAVLAAVILSCFIVGILTFSWGRDSERDSQRAAEYHDYRERREGAFCAGLSGTLLAKCQIEQEQAAREAYQSERDLEAQRDMSLWALAVFIIGFVTAGLTLWALWYVRGTLLATREALEDTGKATFAMVDANRIAANAQRPWVVIEAGRPIIKQQGKSVMIRLPIVFRNIGKTVAIGFWPNVKIYASGAEYETGARTLFDIWRQPKGTTKQILMPGETSTQTPLLGVHPEHLPWFGEGKNRRVNIVIQAAAFYYSQGCESFAERLFTERTFRIGTESEDWFSAYIVFAHQLAALRTTDFVIAPCGPRDAR